MSMSLAELVNQASGEMGLLQPGTVIGNATNQTIQLLALTQRLGKDLVREFEWQRLVKTHQFLTLPQDSSLTGDLTDGDDTITTISSTATLTRGMLVTATTFSGIPLGAEITSIDSSVAVTLNVAATATGSTGLLFKTQDYDLPSDFHRMISDTHWNRTNFWQGRGSRSSQAWQAYQGGIMAISAWPDQYRIYGNKLRLMPAPTAEYNMAFEYVSNLWVLAIAGVVPVRSAFSADTDTCVFPDDLMLAGIKYYFLRAKKLDFGIEMAEFMDILSTCKTQDVPAETISQSRSYRGVLAPSITDGSWDVD
jgi:hypothetical protein